MAKTATERFRQINQEALRASTIKDLKAVLVLLTMEQARALDRIRHLEKHLMLPPER